MGGKGIFKLEPGPAREVQGAQLIVLCGSHRMKKRRSKVCCGQIVKDKHAVPEGKLSERHRTGLLRWQQGSLEW